MSTQSHTAAEILALVRANRARQEGTSHVVVANDYFSNRDSFKDIKAAASDAIQGATLLNDKNDNVILKSVAPVAHIDADVRGDFPVSDDKALAALPASPVTALAASATTPDNSDTSSLCSSASEDKSVKPQATPAEPDTDDLGVDLDDVAVLDDEAEPELFDPDFYKVRVDYFDNGVVKNKTQHTAKLTMQINPTSAKEDDYVCIANFYSRSRDLRQKVKAKDMWNGWYDDLEAFFAELCAAERSFELKPQIAILKEQGKDQFGKTRFEPVGYSACIIYKEHGKPHVVHMFYQNFIQSVALDKPFTKTKQSSLVAIGLYRDEARAHLEPRSEEPKKMIVRDRSFFGK